MIRRLLTLLLTLLSLVVLSPYTGHAQTATQAASHTVVWGDTLASIGRRYGVSVDAILAANNLASADQIYAGQQLVIPGGSAPQPSIDGVHVVQAGDTLFSISQQYGVPVEALVATNGLASSAQIFTGQRLSVSAQGAAAPVDPTRTHTVQAGETLFSIGQRYGVAVDALVRTNNLLSASSIYAGQVLALPGTAAPPANSPGYTPSAASSSHVVVAGETLTAIANRYGISVWALAQTNNIANPSAIQSGQVLTVPDVGSLNPPAAAQPSAGAAAGKRIIVDVSDQRTYLYVNNTLQRTLINSTGLPGADTWRGEFAIQNKIPNAYASTWDLQMPYWLGFYWAGPLQNGFHALPILSNGLRLWENLLGQPASYGCVIHSEADARLLYNWAEIGTPVTVRD
ncbi:MAG: LysM peptidoglycan-binding domain-containing protein [Anaerolineae bacterium]